MPNTKLAKIITNPFVTSVYFFAIAASSFVLISTQISLTAIIQVLTVLILLTLISVRFFLPSLKDSKPAAILLGLAPAILFGYVLVFSTGGLSSPFLVITHLFSIALAFSLSPQIAVSFIVATAAILLCNLVVDPIVRVIVLTNPFAAILYFSAYIALVPFSYVLASEYKLKERWVKALEKQIATSKNQEDVLLKNIEDNVIALNNKFDVVYLNKAAITFSKYDTQITGKNFFELFTLRDNEGRNLETYSLPFAATLTAKVQSTLNNIQIASKEKIFKRVDLKILPVIEDERTVGLILILKERTASKKTEEKEQTAALVSLSRFLYFLNSQKREILELERKSSNKTQTDNILKRNIELENLAQDFIYSLRVDSGEIGALSSLIDIGKLTEEILFEQKPEAQEIGISLTAKAGIKTNDKIMRSKDERIIPQAKKIFPTIYIIGNLIWAKNSLNKLLEVVFFLSPKGSSVTIDVIRGKGDLAQILINTQITKIPSDLAPQLFEKFYGRLQELPELSQATGLEGFLAKTLIDYMGGNITIESDIKSSALVFNITFGLSPTEESKIKN